MNAKFIRSEHLLWMIPIVYGIIVYFTAINAEVMLFIDGAYVVISFFQVCFCFLLLLAIPYLIHWELRDRDLRHPVIAWSHIILSTALVVGILLIYSYSLPINVNWVYHSGVLPAVAKWNYYNAMALVFVKTFLAVQIVFVVYGATQLLLHQRMLSRAANQSNSDYLEDMNMVEQQMIA